MNAVSPNGDDAPTLLTSLFGISRNRLVGFEVQIAGRPSLPRTDSSSIRLT
jgi:hypothetical protein